MSKNKLTQHLSRIAKEAWKRKVEGMTKEEIGKMMGKLRRGKKKTKVV